MIETPVVKPRYPDDCKHCGHPPEDHERVLESNEAKCLFGPGFYEPLLPLGQRK